MANERKLRILIDSSGARKGSKEVTKEVGRIVASGKQAIKTFQELQKVMKSLESTSSGRNYQQIQKAVSKQAGTTDELTKATLALTKARQKLENTMYAEQARTQALGEEVGKNSVKVQEQRRLTEELARSKERLNMVNSKEYTDLVRTRKAIEDRNKQIRMMDSDIKKSTISVTGLQSAFSSLGTVMAGVAVYFSVDAIARTADEYTNITNKLKAVSAATVDTTNATRDLLDLSIDSRSSLEGTMEIYSKMTRVNEDLGKSQKEVRDLTEAVSKAVAMSGASVQGAQGALMQFSQAMSGDFKSSGQELNSILEQTPMLAVAIAKGLREVTGDMNITTGSLKSMAAAGKLSTDLVFEAMLEVLPKLRKQFESTDQTMASAADGLKGSFTVMLGELDKTYGTSESVVEIMKDLGETLVKNGDSVLAFSAALAGIVGAAALGGLIAALVAIGPLVVGVVGAIGLLAGGLTKVYLESTKSQRSLDLTNKSLSNLKNTTEDYNEAVRIMSTSKVQDSMQTLNKEILDATVKLEAASEEQLRLNGILKGGSNWDIFVAALGEDLGDNLALAKEEAQALQEVLDELGNRLRSLSERRSGAILEGAVGSVENFHDSIKALTGGLTDYEKVEESYKTTLKNLNSEYDKSKKKVEEVGDSTERLNLINQLNRDLTEGQKRALASYNEELDKLNKKNKDKKIEPTNFMVSYKDIQDEITALKAGTDAYEDLLIKRQALSDLGDEATPLKLEGLIAKYKELKALQDSINESEKRDVIVKESIKNVDSLRLEAEALGEGAEAYKKYQISQQALQLSGGVLITEDDKKRYQEALSLLQEMDAITSKPRNPFLDGIQEMFETGINWNSIGDVLGSQMGGYLTSLLVKEGGNSEASGQLGAAGGAVGSIWGPVGAMIGQTAGSVLGAFVDEVTVDFAKIQAEQFTGEILGATDEQTMSLVNALSKIEDLTDKMLGVNRDMLNALTATESGIKNVTNSLLSLNFDYSSLGSTDIKYGGIVGASIDIVGALSGGLLGSSISKIIGGSSKVSDSGVRVLGNSFTELMEGATVQAYRTIKTRKSWFSSTKTNTSFKNISKSLTRPIAEVMQSIGDVVTSSGQALGYSVKEVEKLMSKVRISTKQISTKGMNSDQINKALSAYFSSVFNTVSQNVFSFVKKFQEAGEAFGDTLVRVTTNFQTVNEVLKMMDQRELGKGTVKTLTVANQVIEALGGSDNAASTWMTFFESFASEADQLSYTQDSLTEAFERLGMTLPDTREGLWNYVKTLNLTNSADRDRLSLITQLTSSLDDYYGDIEDLTDSAFSGIVDWLNEIRGTTIDGYQSLSSAQSKFQQQLSLAMSGDATALGTITDYADSVLTAAEQSAGSGEQFRSIKENVIQSVASIPKFADGGFHTGGLRLVGERGPELEYTGSSSVYNDSQMSRIFDTSALEARLASMEQVIRTGLVSVVKNTGKTYKQLNQWDGEGLPETRVV